jgi:hypothetical protein
MLPPVLWVYFLGDAATDDQRPTLWIGERSQGTEISLTPRARSLIGALAVPPEMARGPAWESSTLSTWTSAEVTDRMHHSHRSSITKARADLAERFAESGLELDHYLRTEGGYALNNVRVDAVEILRKSDDPEAVGALLATFAADAASTGFAAGTEELWSRAAREGVADAIAAAFGETDVGNSEPRHDPDSANPRVFAPEVEAHLDTGDAQTPSPGATASRGSPRALIAAIAIAVLAAAVVFLITGAGNSPDPSSPTAVGARIEVTGGLAHTWSDYKTGEGEPGRRLAPEEEVEVSCRIRGFEVGDGNVWWYRIKPPPWNNRFYATADAFYNDGERSGPLKETPFFDPVVPICEEGQAA